MQWMGAIKIRVQTADKSTTPVHQLMSYEAKCYAFVTNQFTSKTFLTSNCGLGLKYESSIHNIALSTGKVI